MKEIWKLPAFRWYWSGLVLSALGDQLGWMGLTWFMMRETHSPAVVGSLVMAYFLPSVFAGLFIGVLLDRWNRRLLIVADNMIRGSLLLVIIGIVWFFHPPAWIVIVLVAILGLLAPISSAGAQTILPAFIEDKELLTKANSLMQSQWQLVYLVGPALAGLMIGYFGEEFVLFLDAVSFFICAICFYKMKERTAVESQPLNIKSQTSDKIWKELWTGYHYIGKRPHFIVLLVITLFFNMAYGPLEVALPFFAKEKIGWRRHAAWLFMDSIGTRSIMRFPLVLDQNMAVSHWKKLSDYDYFMGLDYAAAVDLASFRSGGCLYVCCRCGLFAIQCVVPFVPAKGNTQPLIRSNINLSQNSYGHRDAAWGFPVRAIDSRAWDHESFVGFFYCLSDRRITCSTATWQTSMNPLFTINKWRDQTLD